MGMHVEYTHEKIVEELQFDLIYERGMVSLLRKQVELLTTNAEILQGINEALQAQRDFLEKQIACTK